MNLLNLGKKLNALADNLPAIAHDIKKEFVVVLTEDLAYATPVDTSAALSNWRVSMNEPLRRFIDPHYPGIFGSTAMSSVRETVELARITAALGKAGQLYWISNSAPYIIDLNNGSSKQAPALFIQKTIANSIKKIEPIAKRVINDYRKRRY